MAIKCKFYEPGNQSFLVNLSLWDEKFRSDSFSLKDFNEVYESLVGNFELTKEDLRKAIQDYLDVVQESTGENLETYKSKLNTIFSDTKPTSTDTTGGKDGSTNALNGSDPKPADPSNDDNEDLDDVYEAGLHSSKYDVDFTYKITSTLDLSKLFSTNTALLNRFKSKLNQDFFKLSFINYDEGKIIKTIAEINNNIANYKNELYQILKSYSDLTDVDENLYNSDGRFNLRSYQGILTAVEERFNSMKGGITSYLNSINDRIFTNPKSELLDTYYAYITLRNFDNLVNLLSNGSVVVNPRYLGSISTPNTNEYPKYLPFTKNTISSTFFGKSDLDVSIERETSSITKSIITNIKRLDFNGKWDGYSFLSLQAFNSATSKLTSNRVKNIIKLLNNSHLDPINTYIKFFNDYVRGNNIKKLKDTGLFTQDELNVLKSIDEQIFNPKPMDKSHSLYGIILANQKNLNFNYFLDILAYMNKQGPTEYLSYQYDPETKEFELDTLSDTRYTSILRNYETSIANTVADIHTTTIWEDSILKGKFNLKADGLRGKENRNIIITLGGKQFLLSENGLSNNELNTIHFPSVDEYSDYLNTGRIKSKNPSIEILRGIELFELLQNVTGLPFKNTSGQLYHLLKNGYNNEQNLKSDLIVFLHDVLEDAIIAEEIHINEINDKEVYSPSDYISKAKEFIKFISQAGLSDKNAFENYRHRPRLNVSKNSKGQRTSFFTNLVNALSIINGDNVISVFKNSDGDNVPSVGLMNLVKTLPDFVKIVQEQYDVQQQRNKNFKNIFEENPFFPDTKLITGTVLKTEFVNSNGDVVQKNKFNISEYTVSSILLDFYKNLIEDRDVLFLPTVYADKANQTLIRINKDIKFNGVSLSDATSSDIETEYRKVQQTYYKNLFNNLLYTYSKLANKLGITTIADHIDRNTSKATIKQYIDSINEMLYKYSDDGKKSKNNTLAILNTAIVELEQEDPYFEWINEVHFSIVDGRYRFNPFIEKMMEIFKVSTNSDSEYNKFIDRSKNNFINDLTQNNIRFDSNVFKFTKNIDGISIGEDGFINITDKDGNLTELFDKFFFFDGYMSTQFMQITAGEPYAHPSKLKIKFKGNEDNYFTQDISARLIAQYKRMVMMQGTIHNYFQGALEGTGSRLRVAVINDIKGKLSLPSGNTVSGDALDGSMACTGWQNELENNSMFSSTAGQNRKNFGFNLDPITGTPTLFKCASFAMDNYELRKSRNKIDLLRKMSDKTYPIPVDLTKDFYGEERELKDVVDEKIYYWNSNDGKYYRIDNIRKGNSENEYEIVESQVSIEGIDITGGKRLRRVVIDSNFKLWKAFGGEDSMSLSNDGINKRLEYSNSSIHAVAQFINKTGYFINKDLLDLIEKTGYDVNHLDRDVFPFDPKYVPDDITSDTFLTQSTVYQPMKYSDIHYVVNSSAIKVGARNVNPINVRAEGNDTPLQTFSIGSQYFGIQMDPDHHADDSSVTEATQIISTLACNGKTREFAQQVYMVLGQIVDLTLKDYLNTYVNKDGVDAYKEISKMTADNKSKLYKILTKALLNSIQTDRNSDMLTVGYLDKAAIEFENNLNQEFNSEEFNYKIPFSSGTIFNKFMVMLASRINSDSIRRTFSGMGAVMKPSYDYVKYYHFNGSEGFKTAKGEKLELKGAYTYKDLQFIATQAGYVNNGTTPIDQLLNTGNLLVDTPIHQIRMGDTVIYTDAKGKEVELTINTYKDYRLIRDLNVPTIKVNKNKESNLRNLHITFKFTDSDAIYSIYDLEPIKKSFALQEKAEDDITKAKSEYEIQNIKRKLKLDLAEQFKERDALLAQLQEGKELTFNGEVKQLENVIIEPAEVVLSKNYKTRFMLRSGDSISEILRDPVSTFKSRLQKLQDSARDDLADTVFDAALLNPHGANTLILIDDGSDIKINEISNKSKYEEIPVPKAVFTNDSGEQEWWRIDDNGYKLYRIEGLRFYRKLDKNTPQEVIVVPKSNIGIISSIASDSNYQGLYYNFMYGTDTVVDLVRTLNSDRELNELGILNATGDVKKLAEYNYELLNEKKLNKQAERMARSFDESLNITANRIPAQTYQSIMTMRVIDFTDSEANEVYVPLSQTVLQGSDYGKIQS